MRGEDIGQTGAVDGQGLLYEHVLLRPERRTRLRGVLVVTGDDEHRVHVRVLKHARRVRRARLEPVLVREVPRRETAVRGDSDQAGRAFRGNRRYERSRGERPCPDDAHPDRSLYGARDSHRDGPAGRLPGGILEQDAERVAATDELVRLFRALYREAMADETLGPHRADGALVQERFHVALLGPAHVPGRIVVAKLLLRRIVAARPVRPRLVKGELLVVVRPPRDLHAYGAYDHDPCPVPAHVPRQDHGIVGTGRRADEDPVDAAASGHP